MGKTDYEELRQRYVEGNLTPEENKKFEIWLEMRKTSGEVEMTDAEMELLSQRIKSDRVSMKEFKSDVPEPLRKAGNSRWLIRMAAGLAILSVLGYGIYGLTKNSPFTFIASSKSNIQKIILADGSLVWVHGDSKLSYYEKPDGRFAELDGEAFFEVAKDASRPFTIKYNNVNVRVVGTSFNLKTGETVELKVLTGKVNFSLQGEAGLDVAPFEQATYSSAKGLHKVDLPPAEAAAITTNTEYDMDFVNETLDLVVRRLQEKFDVAVQVTNTDMMQCHVNLDITDHSLDSSLEMIEAILNVKFARSGNVITLTGTGCK